LIEPSTHERSTGEYSALHVICERDVGLFSLVQQVIAHVPFALSEGRTPIALFGPRTCYWTPKGHHGADTVWEYYFCPLVPNYPATAIPPHVFDSIRENPPDADHPGYMIDKNVFVSAHFGDHPALTGRTLNIPYLWNDPGPELRSFAASVIEGYVRPRKYLQHKVDQFYASELQGYFVIGVHLRGTDAVSPEETRAHRQASLILPNYLPVLQQLIEGHPRARIFVATDDKHSLDFMLDHFGYEYVRSYSSIYHTHGPTASTGPTGWIMPAYIAGDRDVAAEQGEEAVADYLLLSRSDYLVHNGSSLARTALLRSPGLPHVNIHTRSKNGPNVDLDVVRRVRARKASRLDERYERSPRVAFVVHSFNRVQNVGHLANALRSLGDHELIVCDDGSIDGSAEAWRPFLDRPNDFLLQSNDLHEIRILDRAIRMSNAEIVCLVQDDDYIPDDSDWLLDIVQRFDSHPNLAVVGGFMGFPALGPGTEPLWGHGPFRFVHHVNIGPYLVRRRSFEQMGGWDHSYSEPGEPGICFDSEFCLRAWVYGYEIGYRFVPFKGAPGEYKHNGGTVLFSGSIRARNKFRNEQAMFAKYEPHREAIDAAVEAANQRL